MSAKSKKALVTAGGIVLVAGGVAWLYDVRTSRRISQRTNTLTGCVSPLSLFHITSPLGWRTDPVLGPPAREFHDGVDLRAPYGTQVRSPASGYVRAVASNALSGTYILIEHDNGWRTGFAHMDPGQFVVAEGQHVSPGQPVGATGHGGKSTGPHLHWTVHDLTLGLYRDPAAWLEEGGGP